MSTAPTILNEPPAVPNGAPNPTPPGGGAPPPIDWRLSLSDDLRADKSLEGFKDISAVAKSLIDTKKMVGDAIRVPKDGAPKEELDKFYARLGRPESADKYELKRPELPAGTPYDEELETAFKGMAHEAGLQNRQAQILFDKYNAMQLAKLDAYNKGLQAGVDGLKKEWGPEWDTKIGLAQRAVKEVAGPEVQKLLDETGLGNHPELIKFFAKLGEQAGETPIVIGDAPAVSGGVEAIQAKIDAIRNDPNHPYQNPKATHTAHAAAVREVTGLYEQLTAAKGETEYSS